MCFKFCSHCQHIRPLEDFTLLSGQEGKQCRICRDASRRSRHPEPQQSQDRVPASPHPRALFNPAANDRSRESPALPSPDVPSKTCSGCGRVFPLDHFRAARGSRETKQCQKCRDRTDQYRLRERASRAPVICSSQGAGVTLSSVAAGKIVDERKLTRTRREQERERTSSALFCKFNAAVWGPRTHYPWYKERIQNELRIDDLEVD